MEITTIATMIGVSVQALSTTLQCYVTFKRSNIEKFFEKLLNENIDISRIGEKEELQRYFFAIIDKVSKEANLEKIEKWKNATIHLAQNFSDFDYKDNFIRTLDDLTVFELTVLYKIYSKNFQKQHFEEELIEYFINKSISRDMVLQAIKRLSTFNLVNEMVDRTAVLGGGEPVLGVLYYTKNDLGKQFLAFISSDWNLTRDGY